MNIINIDSLYIILFIISLYFIINTPIKNYSKWLLKSILFYIGVLFFAISIFISNKVINKYILPIILYFNILTLLIVTFLHKLSLINLIPLFGIIYLLYTFNYKDFELKNGLLIKPNISWIYLHIFFLTLFYLLSDYITFNSKIGLTLLLFYPLLFPINEYFKHRVFSLFFAITIIFLLFPKN
jgi:hypothetical protein